MNNNFGFDLEAYANKPKDTTRLLSQFLNNGHLALLLGGGVSKALSFPLWSELVQRLCEKWIPGEYEAEKNYTGHELKEFIQEVKRKIGNQKEYLDEVADYLYEGVEFDFQLAKKELLIALSALIVGRNRGTVRNIITYNFDSVLEWYLGLMGLQVDSFTKSQFITKTSDVVIAHIHGYLPFSEDFGKKSRDIVFSTAEFQDRMLGKDYWKEYFLEYFRRYTFLAVGMSADSLVNDVCPYLRQMDNWYKNEEVVRRLPYGVAILSPGAETDKKIPILIEHGVIPCVYPHAEIPGALFDIVQTALMVR